MLTFFLGKTFLRVEKVADTKVIHRSMKVIHRSMKVIHRSTKAIHRSMKVIQRSMKVIQRSTKVIQRSMKVIPRSMKLMYMNRIPDTKLTILIHLIMILMARYMNLVNM
jgi:hypothetical protein